MSENTESTANRMKFAPMPMSELLANLLPFEKHPDSANASFSSADESDNSIGDSAAVEPTPVKISNIEIKTPVVKSTQPLHNFKHFTSEKKTIHNEHNKENSSEHWNSNLTHPSKDRILQNTYNLNKDHVVQSSNKKASNYPSSDIKKRNIQMHHNNNIRTHNSAIKKTPEIARVPLSSQKQKSATPKIKSGIRRFTPCSNSKTKKTPQKNLVQNRDRVRCELFTLNQKDEAACPPPKSDVVHKSVPETPLNKKVMPAPYVATPSYPQGTMSNNSKIMLKAISIKDRKYIYTRKLGTGGSSEVFKVLEVNTSCEYALKTVNLGTDPEMAMGYLNEVRLLRELQNSDRVVKLYDYECDQSSKILRLVLEVGETDLASILRERGAGLPPALLLHYWEEMLHAVNYIHEHGVIHADLKPANFLLVCGRLKLIDFGIASAISSDATSVVRSAAAGTFSYISPEALTGGAGGYGSANGTAPIKISFRSDVWSLGCILYSMVYKRTPFAHIPNLAKLAAIIDPKHRIEYPPVERVCPSLMAALKWCLTYNARARPYVRELLAILGSAPLPQHIQLKLQSFITPQASTCCRGLCSS